MRLSRLAIFFPVAIFSALGQQQSPDLGDGINIHPERPSYSPKVDPKLDYDRISFKTPSKLPNALLMETFQDGNDDWSVLSDPKYTGEMKVVKRRRDWIEGDKGLKITTPNAYHGIARQLSKPVELTKPIFGSLEVQYEDPVNCGGAYFKLIQIDDVSDFDSTTPYSIMFGPDRCGSMHKVHLIIKHPVGENKNYVEEHLVKGSLIPDILPEGSHQYGFGLYPNGTYVLYVDAKEDQREDMRVGFQSRFQSPKEIDDPEDKKPEDWIDDATIPDLTAIKPDDWDETQPATIPDKDAIKPDGWLDNEPMMIPKMDAVKPEDWDDDEDGEWIRPQMKNPKCDIGCGKWEPPHIPNPDYKGKWSPPQIPNPSYKGEWNPRKIPNPNYYNYSNPFTAVQSFNAIGFEVWTVEPGAIIDNVFITQDEKEFEKFLDETFKVKQQIEQKNFELLREKAEKDAEEAAKEVESGGVISTFLKDNLGISMLTVAVPVVFLITFIMRRIRSKPESIVSPTDKKTDEVVIEETSGSEKEESEDVTETEDVKSDNKSESDTKGLRERKPAAVKK